MHGRKIGFLTGLMAACLIAGSALAGEDRKLDQPMILVAAPGVKGLYSRAVMMVVPKGTGHVGFMINRATSSTVANAFPGDELAAKVIEPIYLGGPVGSQSLYAVVRNDRGEGSRQLFGDVYVTVSGETVDRVLKETPHDARYFAGYVSWDEGELGEQIWQGEWLYTDAEASLMFHPQPEALWGYLAGRLTETY